MGEAGHPVWISGVRRGVLKMSTGNCAQLAEASLEHSYGELKLILQLPLFKYVRSCRAIGSWELTCFVFFCVAMLFSAISPVIFELVLWIGIFNVHIHVQQVYAHNLALKLRQLGCTKSALPGCTCSISKVLQSCLLVLYAFPAHSFCAEFLAANLHLPPSCQPRAS